MNTIKKSGFTLVELIVVITILAILGVIAFVSFQNYTKDSRDSKRITDTRSIIGKIHIENMKGVPLNDLINNYGTHGITINGNENSKTNIGIANFDLLKEKKENFQDPKYKVNYPTAFAIGGEGENAYNFVQIATISERNNVTRIFGTYYKFKEGDSPSLFVSGSIIYEDGKGPLIYPDGPEGGEGDDEGGGDNDTYTCTNSDISFELGGDTMLFKGCDAMGGKGNSAPLYTYKDTQLNKTFYYYTHEAGQKWCEKIGEGWRLPYANEYDGIINLYGWKAIDESTNTAPQIQAPFYLSVAGGYILDKYGSNHNEYNFNYYGDNGIYWGYNKKKAGIIPSSALHSKIAKTQFNAGKENFNADTLNFNKYGIFINNELALYDVLNGLTVRCIKNTTIRPGICGSAIGGESINAPEYDLCGNNDKNTEVKYENGKWKWSCIGPNNGGITNCESIAKPMEGVCGYINGQEIEKINYEDWYCYNPVKPKNLVFESNKRTWYCPGNNGGKDSAGCSAFAKVVNGECGWNNNFESAEMPEDGLCSNTYSKAIEFGSSSGNWTWKCSGLNGGTISGQCSAPIKILDYTCPNNSRPDFEINLGEGKKLTFAGCNESSGTPLITNSVYGNLYNFSNAKTLCTNKGNGRRLPTIEEWSKIIELGIIGNGYETTNGPSNAPFYLPPGGHYQLENDMGEPNYYGKGYYGYYWSSSNDNINENDIYVFGFRGLTYIDFDTSNLYSPNDGMSVRCVK